MISSFWIGFPGKILDEHRDRAIALHIKQLFHCPNKSLEVVIGQNRLSGTMKATAANTLSGFFLLADKQKIIIEMNNSVPVKKPIIPVSPAN